MKILLFGAAFLVSASVPARAQILPGNGNAAAASSISDAFKNEVHRRVIAVTERWADAWRRDDVRTLMSLYTRRAAVVQADGSIVRAPAEREYVLRRGLARSRACRLSVNDFDVSGDLAIATGSSDCEVEQPGGGLLREKAAFSLVLRQQVDGSWRIQSHVTGAPDEDS